MIFSFSSLQTQLEKNPESLFETLCQARVIRGHGALERSQRLGPALSQRIIDTFDDSDFRGKERNAAYVLN